jgi:hypothetical protein
MMSESKTKLYHTRPTEEPFKYLTGDLSGQGLRVVVDKSTHELVVRYGYGAEEGTLTVLVNPKGVEVTGASARPGTRMLDLDASSSDPMRQAAESTIPPAEKARRYRHKLVDLLEKAEAALRPGAGKAEMAALADEAHTVRTQLDAEERYEARRHAAASRGGAIGVPRGEVNQHFSPKQEGPNDE